MPRDSKSMTDVVEYFDPLSQDQKERARLVVCANAVDAQEAATLMRMLGLFPGQEDDDVSALPKPGWG